MTKPLIAKEIVEILAGRESPAQAVLTLVGMAITDILLTRGITMDLIFIPSDYTFWMVLIVAVVSIIGPVFSALKLKTGSKGIYADWEAKYTVTMIIDMALTPLVGLPILSIIVQELPEPIPPEGYVFILVPLVLLILSYYLLIGLNEGFKGAAVQFNQDKADVKDAIDTVKKQ